MPVEPRPWSPVETYPKGAFVAYDGEVYESLGSVSGIAPLGDSASWRLIESASQSTGGSDDPDSDGVPVASVSSQDNTNLEIVTDSDTPTEFVTRVVGTQGPQDAPGLVWMGEFEEGEAYEIGDAVFSDGQSYIAIQATTGLELTSDETYWDVLTQRGGRGDTGAQGLRGERGERGPTGLTGLQGIAGATGMVGPMGPQGFDGLRGATGDQGPQGEATAIKDRRALQVRRAKRVFLVCSGRASGVRLAATMKVMSLVTMAVLTLPHKSLLQERCQRTR